MEHPYNLETWSKTPAGRQSEESLNRHCVSTRNEDSRWHNRDTSRFLWWAQLQNVCLWLRETSSARRCGMYLRVTNIVMEWKACGPRLCYMRLHTLPIAISFICTYAATEDSSKSDKEKCYSESQESQKRASKRRYHHRPRLQCRSRSAPRWRKANYRTL